MSKLWIIGDSFSTSTAPESWVTLVSAGRELVHLSQNGISEYRIFRKFRNAQSNFSAGDTVILCHTNPVRIFLPDHVSYPARRKSSHPECDLVMGDALQRGLFWRFMARVFGAYFYDEDYFTDQFDLMVAEMDRAARAAGCHVVHMSGFPARGSIMSIQDLFLAHRGTINHLTPEGNRLVAERLLEMQVFLADAK